MAGGRVAGMLLAMAVAAAAGPAPAAPDGQAIFEHGAGIVARVGSAGTRLKPGALGCAGCHGSDARGGVEGSVRAPDITWGTLLASGPERPAYDAEALHRALSTGFDPGGRALDRRMPRFEMDAETFSALRTYLQVVETAEIAGLGPDSVLVGLPEGAEDRAAVLAAVAEFNAAGGAFGRLARPVPAGSDAFLDFEVLLPSLRARMAAEQARRLAATVTSDPGGPARDDGPVYGTAVTVGSSLATLVAEGREVVIAGPPAAAMAWALGQGLDGRSAETRAIADFALAALRGTGRRTTHTAYARSLAAAGMSETVEVFTLAGGK